METTLNWLRERVQEEAVKKQARILEAEEDTSLRQGHQAPMAQMYEMIASVIIKDTVRIDDVYSEIRAIEGVTVVSTTVEKKHLGISREKSVIKIKFMKARRSLDHYVTLLTRTIVRINGVINIKQLSIRKLEHE